MQRDPHEQYLASKVMTATPQKLHLMLVEGAIRYAQRAKADWDDEENATRWSDALTQCLEIAGELLSCVRDSDQPVAKKLAAVYAFIFRTIAEAKMGRDPAKLDDALRLLAIERETWRQVCDRFGGERHSATAVSTAREPGGTPTSTTATTEARDPSPSKTPTAPSAAVPARPDGCTADPLGPIRPLPAPDEGLSLEA